MPTQTNEPVSHTSDSRAVSVSLEEAEADRILACMKALKDTRDAQSREDLALGVSSALEGFMGIEKDLLARVLANSHNE